jgi:hypothetical protein
LAVQNAVPAEVLEWVNWHQLAGVDRFVVFDLGSAAPLNQVHSSEDWNALALTKRNYA